MICLYISIFHWNIHKNAWYEIACIRRYVLHVAVKDGARKGQTSCLQQKFHDRYLSMNQELFYTLIENCPNNPFDLILWYTASSSKSLNELNSESTSFLTF